MERVVASVGAIASVSFLIVSAVMNFRFGHTLGAETIDRVLYGLASLASDGLKIILPFAIGWAFAERRRLAAFLGVALFVVCIAYSVVSAMGFAAVNRAKTGAAIAVAAERYEDLQRERDRLRNALDRAGGRPDLSAIALEIERLQGHRRWAATQSCTNATVQRSITFCNRYRSALARQASAAALEKRIEGLEAALGQVLAELKTVDGRAVAADKDPQVSMLSTLFGANADQVKLGLALLITALVELGSALGFFISMSHLRRHHAVAPPIDITPAEEGGAALPSPQESRGGPSGVRWAENRLIIAEGATAPLTALYADYLATLARDGDRHPLGQIAFSAFLKERGAVEERRVAGRLTVFGMRLRDMRDVERVLSAPVKV